MGWTRGHTREADMLIMSPEPRQQVTKRLVKHAVAALLVIAGLPTCGGGDQTCYTIIIGYAGTRSGEAYAKILGVGDNAGAFVQAHAPSIRELEASFNTLRTCLGPGFPSDRAMDATIWIDVSGMSSTNCTNVLDSQCLPTPADPQINRRILFRGGRYTEVHLDLIDPP